MELDDMTVQFDRLECDYTRTFNFYRSVVVEHDKRHKHAHRRLLSNSSRLRLRYWIAEARKGNASALDLNFWDTYLVHLIIYIGTS